MIAVLLVLLLVVLLFGSGFALHFLWFVAAAVLVAWLLGFLLHREGAHWYRW